MLVSVFGFQVALPLLVVAWLTFLPARSVVGLAVQIFAAAVFLLALALTAMWAIPVWWLPYVYAVLFVFAVALSLFRKNVTARPKWRSDARDWIGLGVSVIFLVAGCWYLVLALAARVPPPFATFIDVANPFGAGHYIVVQGGSRRLLNEHLRTLDTGVERYAAWRGQSYAIDLVGIGDWGLRARGLQPPDPAAYAIFGARLHAPCTGVVLQARDGHPDFQLPDNDLVNRLGNHLILRCSAADIVLAHMRAGSILVETGDAVQVGQQIGQVGNSGASGEPHLHIHAQKPAAPGAAPISGEPLSLLIGGRYLVRGDRLEGVKW